MRTHESRSGSDSTCGDKAEAAEIPETRNIFHRPSARISAAVCPVCGRSYCVLAAIVLALWLLSSSSNNETG